MPQPAMPPDRLERYEALYQDALRSPPAGLRPVLSQPDLAAHFKPVMLAGWWLEEELTLLGCERPERRRLCFLHGQLSLGRDTWEMAAKVLEAWRTDEAPNEE